MGPVFPSRSLSQESGCLGMQFSFTIDQNILKGDTTPLINVVWSKLKCSMASCMCYNK